MRAISVAAATRKPPGSRLTTPPSSTLIETTVYQAVAKVPSTAYFTAASAPAE